MTAPLPDIDALWDYDQPQVSEARFRAALAQAADFPDAYRLELLTQIARAQGLQRSFDAAHATLDEVQAAHPAEARVTIRLALERGRVFNSSSQPEAARPHFITAWEAAQSAGEDAYAVDAAHMLAIISSGDAALDWNLKALALAEQSADAWAQNWKGALYNNIGWAQHDAGDFAGALVTFHKALEWRLAQGKPPQIRIARWCAARALRSLGRLPEALAVQADLLEETEAAHAPDGFVYEELGECLLALGWIDDARPHFAAAHALLNQDQWLAANEPARLARLKSLSEGNHPDERATTP